MQLPSFKMERHKSEFPIALSWSPASWGWLGELQKHSWSLYQPGNYHTCAGDQAEVMGFSEGSGEQRNTLRFVLKVSAQLALLNSPGQVAGS